MQSEPKIVDQQKENYEKHGKIVKWEEIWKQAIYQDGYRETYEEGKPHKMFWQ
jgi:hypothetical protein